jgi:hypothetical protein
VPPVEGSQQHRLSLCGLDHAGLSHPRRDLVISHSETSHRDTDERDAGPSDVEKTVPAHAPQEKKTLQGSCGSDTTDDAQQQQISLPQLIITDPVCSIDLCRYCVHVFKICFFKIEKNSDHPIDIFFG